MTDARLSAAFPQHPKTKKLKKRLGADGPWSLVCLFLWARMNRPNGDLSGMSDEDIELACDWCGGEGALVSALVDVGFIDGEPGCRVVHDWAEHQPWSAGAEDRKQSSAWAALCKRYGRAGAAERMPDYAERLRAACDPDATRMRPAQESHAERMPNACGTDAPLPLPLPSPSPSPKDSGASAPDLFPASPATPARRSPIELRTWLDSLPEDEDPIQADDPIIAYAEQAGIRHDWLILCWSRFRADMIERKTKKRDWRAHFRNAVRANWYRLWWIKDGQSGLTTVGEQERRAA